VPLAAAAAAAPAPAAPAPAIALMGFLMLLLLIVLLSLLLMLKLLDVTTFAPLHYSRRGRASRFEVFFLTDGFLGQNLLENLRFW
jgi:hypothetical protein